MAVYQGTDGYFVAGAVASEATVGGINRWTITKTSDPIDVSVFGDRWKDYVNGSVGWSAGLSGFIDTTDAATADIEDSIDDGTVIGMYAHLTDAIYYTGTGYTTNFTVEDTHDGVATISMDIQGTGELTRTWS